MTETSAVLAAEPAAGEAGVPAQPDDNAIWVAFEEASAPVLEEEPTVIWHYTADQTAFQEAVMPILEQPSTFWNYSPDQTACQGAVMPVAV